MTTPPNINTIIEEFEAQFGDCTEYRPEHYKEWLVLTLQSLGYTLVEEIGKRKIAKHSANLDAAQWVNASKDEEIAAIRKVFSL